MTDKQQIEEMAEIIYEACNGTKCSECETSGNEVSACIDVKSAEALYTAGYRKVPDNIGEFSDGYHTFKELYHHRAVLFSVICNAFPERSWKSKLHDTGDMFEGMFIVGIETEQGQATYHYDIEPYWDIFKVKELEKAPKWDGHTSSEAIDRIGNMSSAGYRKRERGEWIIKTGGYYQRLICSACERSSIATFDYCPNCGADMRKEDEGK